MRLCDLARLVSGTPHYADPDAEIVGTQTLRQAGEGEVAFLANQRYKSDFEDSGAGVILLGEAVFPDTRRPVIRIKDPYLAFALTQRYFHPLPLSSGDRHPAASIDPTANVASDVDLGALSAIEAGACIGAGTRIGAGCVVGRDAQIGERCILYPRSAVLDGCVVGDGTILQSGAIIGSDGFGYAWDGGNHVKIPQTGRVIVGRNVEVGANTCIDRGTIDDTVIEDGVKLDNLIQIGHNVHIGAGSIMASQVGISGSSRVGRWCQFGGKAGLAGHISIGDNVKLAAKAGVVNDLPANGVYAGFPAMPHRLWLKATAILRRLPGERRIKRKSPTAKTLNRPENSMLNIDYILEKLPHRYPFLLVDRVLELTAEKSIRALKNVTITEPFFQGHFPGHPVMPGVLIVEAMAQAGGILAFESSPGDKDRLVYFTGIDKVRFRKPVRPGDSLIFTLTVLRHRGDLWKLHGEARVEEHLVCEGDLTAVLVSGNSA